MTEIDLTPITRLEYDIDAILNDHAVAEPITRIELILADIVAGNTTTVVPVTRIETFLAIISGADYPAPEPVTRIETFLAIIAGEDYEEPEAVTRLEGLLAEWVEKGSDIWKTVSGTLIHITDALASPMQKCEVTLEPIQAGSGDPSPTNVRPITGWTGCNVTHTGKNLIGLSSMEAGKYNTTTGEKQSDTSSSNCYRTKELIAVEENQPLTLSNKQDSATFWPMVVQFDDSGNYLGVIGATANVYSFTFTPTAGCTRIGFYFATSKKGINYFFTTAEIQLEKGSSRTSYEASNITTYPISWQTEAGTVYGGTLDVVNGTLTIDKYFEVFDGSQDESWSKYGTGSAKNFAMKISPAYRLKTPTNSEIIIRSNYLRSITAAATWGNYSNFISAPGVANPAIVTGINTITTVEDWREYLSENPLQVVYTLYSPITYQLTPQEITTLAGENNIWADVNGTITLTYKSDGRDSDKADTGKADFMTLTS